MLRLKQLEQESTGRFPEVMDELRTMASRTPTAMDEIQAMFEKLRSGGGL